MGVDRLPLLRDRERLRPAASTRHIEPLLPAEAAGSALTQTITDSVGLVDSVASAGSQLSVTITDVLYVYDVSTPLVDNFALADGSVPDPALWVLNSGSPDILSQSLHLPYSNGSATPEVTSVARTRDGELLFRHRFGTSGVTARTEVWFRDGGDGTQYGLYIRGDTTSCDLKRNPGFVTLGTLVLSANDTQWRWFRVQWIGTAVRVRQWLQGATEPSTWAVDTTATEDRGVGYMQALSYLNSGTGSYAQYVDDVTLTDLSASGPTATITTGSTAFTATVSDTVGLSDLGETVDVGEVLLESVGLMDSRSIGVGRTLDRVLSIHTGA